MGSDAPVRACGSWYAVSLVLPALLAAQCTDPDTMPTFTLSLLAALSLSWLRLRLRHSRWSWAVDVVVLPSSIGWQDP